VGFEWALARSGQKRCEKVGFFLDRIERAVYIVVVAKTNNMNGNNNCDRQS
jgi:hypothetical protein